MQKIIDISHYQTVTDWTKVKNSVHAIILKATQGHGLTSTSYLFTDSKFHEYAKACIRHNIPFGAYHFFTGRTEKDAIEEADYFAKVLAPYKDRIMYAVCDAENYNNKWLLGLTKNQLSANITAFCRRMEKHGYYAAHYTTTDHIRSYIDIKRIPYPVWQAQYSNSRPQDAGDNLIAWQYTDKGKVSGIRENVDMNLGYIDKTAFAIMKLCAVNVIDTPAYWREHCRDVQYLDLFLYRAANKIKKAGTPCKTLDEALDKLTKAGLLNTPDHWRKKAPAVKYLTELFKKIGGSL